MSQKLLLIEDDPGYDALVRRIMGPYMAEIITAKTMGDARRDLAMHKFNAVILDLGLPDSLRDETIAAIPAIKESQPESVLVVVTGSDDDEVKKKCIEAGADSFISKQSSNSMTI